MSSAIVIDLTKSEEVPKKTFTLEKDGVEIVSDAPEKPLPETPTERGICPGCECGSLGQRAHMEEPYGCLAPSNYHRGRY